MDIEIKDRMVHISMKGHIMEAIEWGGNQSGKGPATPATAELFNNDKSSNLLPVK